MQKPSQMFGAGLRRMGALPVGKYSEVSKRARGKAGNGRQEQLVLPSLMVLWSWCTLHASTLGTFRPPGEGSTGQPLTPAHPRSRHRSTRRTTGPRSQRGSAPVSCRPGVMKSGVGWGGVGDPASPSEPRVESRVCCAGSPDDPAGRRAAGGAAPPSPRARLLWRTSGSGPAPPRPPGFLLPASVQPLRTRSWLSAPTRTRGALGQTLPGEQDGAVLQRAAVHCPPALPDQLGLRALHALQGTRGAGLRPSGRGRRHRTCNAVSAGTRDPLHPRWPPCLRLARPSSRSLPGQS